MTELTREPEVQINGRWLRGPTSKLVPNPDNPEGRRVRERTPGTEFKVRNHEHEPNKYFRAQFIAIVTNTETGDRWVDCFVDGQFRSYAVDRIVTVHSTRKVR